MTLNDHLDQIDAALAEIRAGVAAMKTETDAAEQKKNLAAMRDAAIALSGAVQALVERHVGEIT